MPVGFMIHIIACVTAWTITWDVMNVSRVGAIDFVAGIVMALQWLVNNNRQER